MTEIKPGDRITVTAVVESAGHDDQHVIVRVGSTPVQVPVPVGTGNPADDPAAQVAEIRAILAAFDWERDDRQYALERIEMIVATAETEV